MSGFDPAVWPSYGAYLRAKGIQVRGSLSVPVRRERLDEGGHRRREVMELTESGAVTVVTNRSDRKGDHQDVTVHAPLVTGSAVAR